MAKTKVQKKELLNQYKDRILQYKGIVVVRPNGILPNEINEFRKELFDMGAQFNVVKNSIFKIALKESNLPEIESLNAGENAVLFMGEDFVSPSKQLKKFVEATKPKDKDVKIELLGGILEGNLLSKEEATALSEMPDKKGSISMILGILDNAISGVVNVLEDAPRSYVTIIDQAFKE